MVQKFIHSLGKDSPQRAALSPKTIKNIHGVLHRSLHQAVIIGYMRTNPADNCTLPRVIRPEITPMDDPTISRFIQACETERYKELFLITLFTGLRQSEVLGLEWSCIDFERGIMTVKKQLQREKKPGGKFYLTTLKNGKTRTICLAPFVLALFRERMEKQSRERQNAYDLWHEDFPGLVFETETGNHVSHTTIRKHFKRIVNNIGIPEERFHDLRHSFAVASLQNGDDIKTVQENLGHHSAAFTLDVYGHVTDRMKQASAQRMEEYFSKLKQ
jgi:integrase